MENLAANKPTVGSHEHEDFEQAKPLGVARQNHVCSSHVIIICPSADYTKEITMVHHQRMVYLPVTHRFGVGYRKG